MMLIDVSLKDSPPLSCYHPGHTVSVARSVIQEWNPYDPGARLHYQ